MGVQDQTGEKKERWIRKRSESQQHIGGITEDEVALEAEAVTEVVQCVAEGGHLEEVTIHTQSLWDVYSAGFPLALEKLDK